MSRQLVAAEALPKLRGWLHAAAVPLALVGGVVLALVSSSPVTQVGSAVFSVSALLTFLASSAEHLGRWSPQVARRVRRLDHASIFVLIAGSYTPFTLLLLDGGPQVTLLVIAWSGATLGVAFRLLWPAAPRWLTTGLYLTLGWVAVVFVHEFFEYKLLIVPALLVGGALLYTTGGIVYGLRRPDPWPRWFGFHEVFHTCTVSAFAAQWTGVLLATIAVRPH